MLTDGAKAYTYSTRNQQKTYSDEDTSTSYTYYYDGLRKSKTVGTNTTYFIWHNGNMVYEFTPTSSNSYTYGLRLISSDDAKYVLNAHGDVVALLNDSGAVAKRYDYDAFGNELNIDTTDINPFRYCAEYFDTETGTIYLRARYYNPVTGRFTQLDPIKDGLNWYAYCCNNPVMFVDIFGLAPTKEEAAAMANHIYDWEKDSSRDDRTVVGWRLIDVWRGRESMKMGIYIRDSDDWQNPSEYALVFRGSIIEFNFETIDVWKNNAEQFLSTKSADMWDAINYSIEFSSSHSQEITYIGHSKGGAEALAAAVATGKNAIVFNPAKPNLKDYNLSNINYSGKATSYVVRGEILNNLFGEPGVGQVKYLNQKYTTPPYFTGYVGKIANGVNSIRNHLMEAVLSGI